MEAFTLDTPELTLLSAGGILFIIQLCYYTVLYNRIHRCATACRKENIHFAQECPPVSVIICARNESENLRRHLPAVMEQDYPEYEVIVINDGSTDESEDVLTALEEKYRHLYHSFTPEGTRYLSRKKLGLTLGIKASKYDWLVFTEADSYPASNQWLRQLARNFTSSTQVVLGHSSYEYRKGRLNRIITFDTLFMGMRYLGFGLAGKPYAGFGRNLAYRKELFYKEKGYSNFLNLQRGEDDLFVNRVANENNTRVETDAKSVVVRSVSAERYKEWKEEKVSYFATSRYYKGVQHYLLGLETGSRLLFYATCVACIALGVWKSHWLLAGSGALLWMLRYVVQVIVINRTAADLGEKQRYYFSLPLFDILQPLQTLRFKLYRLYRGKGDFMRR